MAYEYDWTVPELAKKWKVCEPTVVSWIKAGKLHGDTFANQRPKYRVLDSEVSRFEKEDLPDTKAKKEKKVVKAAVPKIEKLEEKKPTSIDLAQFMEGLEKFANAIKNHPELVELIVECAKGS